MLGTVIVVCATALGAGGALALSARSWVYNSAQQDAYKEFSREIDAQVKLADGDLPTPANMVVTRDGRDVSGSHALASEIPDSLRESVDSAGPDLYKFERLSNDWVAIGYKARDRPSSPHDVAYFTVRPLEGVQAKLDRLMILLALSVGGSVVLGVAFGALVVRAVVRPLRVVESTAEKIADGGDSSIRMPSTGVRELHRMTESLNDMLEKNVAVVSLLRDEEQRAKRFVADVSHELRSPLAALVPTAEVLGEELADDPGVRGRAARILSQEITALASLVEDLLEMTRRDAGLASIAVESVDVTALITEELRRRGWQHVTVCGEASVFVTDPRRLTAVVTNLVGNALRHGAEPVAVRLDQREETLTVTVSDHGPGVPADHVTRIFERLYKASDARTRTGGAGLGLAIARENAQLLGGDVSYQRVGDVTEFVVRIAAPVRSSSIRPESSTTRGGRNFDGSF
ncbi:Sensor histidine kinase MtrB [Gordonia sp. MP11Mi]|uniref:histidine kinase n=2 Tax=Gordonia sp. MP11Mi TaxID=3022769 RepID=A0AA97CW18_9ACTN